MISFYLLCLKNIIYIDFLDVLSVKMAGIVQGFYDAE